MARIKDKKKIPIKDVPNVEDYLVGSDSEDGGKTSNFKIGAIRGGGGDVTQAGDNTFTGTNDFTTQGVKFGNLGVGTTLKGLTFSEDITVNLPIKSGTLTITDDFKTINGESLIGSTDIVIDGSGAEYEILVSDGLGSSVQAALDSAEAQAGVPVRITEDIPALDFPILMDSNQTLIFEGVTIFVKNGITGGTAIGGTDPLGYWNSHAVIKNRQGGGTSTNSVVRDYLRGNSIEGGETNITVIGGTIDGSNIPDDVGNVGIEFVYNGVQLHDVTNSRVENVTFQSVLRRSGIEQGNVDVRNSSNVIVKNINATDTWYSGTYVMDGSHITIDGGYIHETGDSGIIAVNSDYGVIQNVYVDDCGQKPDLTGASNITSNMRFGKFINNKSINAGLYLSTRGGSINAYGFTLGHPDGFSAYNSIVSGNHFEGNASKGIFLQGAGTVNNIVSNNMLIDNGNLNPAINTGGINLQGVGSNKVIGNTCIGNYNGIVLSNLTADSIIESNTIVDSTLYGINVDSATNTITKLNDITNSGTSDYRDIATGSTLVSFEAGNLTADNLSGTNTGDVTLTTTGSGAATLVGQALNIPISGSGSVDDTAYAVSWDGVTTVAPSKNAVYDMLQTAVFTVDPDSNVVPIFWRGLQAEFTTKFGATAPDNYFTVVTDANPPAIEGTDIASTGEVGGTKYLREDGDGTSSWQPIVGGASIYDNDGTVGVGVTRLVTVDGALNFSNGSDSAITFNDTASQIAIISPEPIIQSTDSLLNLKAGQAMKITGGFGIDVTIGVAGTTQVPTVGQVLSAKDVSGGLEWVDAGGSSVTTGTGTAIDVTNVVGAYYNIGASSTATAFTVPTVAVGGFAVVESASTTTEPTITVTGGTAIEIPSLSWVVSTTMYLNIYSYDGINVFYYWSDTASSIDGFTASTISNASANAGLLGTEEVIVNTSGVLEKTTTQDIANLGGLAVDGETFNGELNFVSSVGLFYEAYDLGASGSITFSELAGGKIFGTVYLPVISDGITPLASESNLNAIFKEKYGVPDNTILPAGNHILYMLKTPPNAINPTGAIALNIPENNDVPVAPESVPMTITDVVDGVLSGTDPIILSASASSCNAEAGILNIVDGNYIQTDYNGELNNATVISLTSKTVNTGWLNGSFNTELEHAIFISDSAGTFTQQLGVQNNENLPYTSGLWKTRLEILGTDILYKVSTDGGANFTVLRTEPIGINPLNIFLNIAVSGNEMLNPRIVNV